MASRDSLEAAFARPIAHRGLHDRAAGVIENSAAAVAAAIAAGYGVEVDVQPSVDGRLMVFHDDGLERLTAETGPVAARSAAELARIGLAGSAAGDRIWTLDDLLDLAGGRAALVIELKSRWNGDVSAARTLGRRLAAYGGPAVAKSFDPAMVAALRRAAPALPRGIVGCAFADRHWDPMPAAMRFRLRNLAHWPLTRPDFLSWQVADLPALAARVTGVPVMSWTVRTAADRARAARLADQIVFEGFSA